MERGSRKIGFKERLVYSMWTAGLVSYGPGHWRQTAGLVPDGPGHWRQAAGLMPACPYSVAVGGGCSQ